jgi:hypothetical protein
MCRSSVYFTRQAYGGLITFVLVLGLLVTNVTFGLTFDIRIATDMDDVEQHLSNGDIDPTSTDLELAYEDAGNPATDEQIVGLRFVNILIPQGTQVTIAYVEFEVDAVDKEGSSYAVNLIIEGELTPNATPFLDATNNITNRPLWTTAKVKWSIPAWTATNVKWRTPDISPIIQEIVNQAGWAGGNALILIFRDDKSNPSKGLREAEAFEGEAPAAPLLHLEIVNLVATQPDPPDGAPNVTTPLVEWTPGDTAKFHDVYFGTNPTPGPAEFKGRQTYAKYFYADGLIPRTTYYWRIDEVDADGTTTHTGSVWSFTAAPLKAYDPDPPDGVKCVTADVTLAWSPGATAITHDVYFGTDKAAVTGGTGGTAKPNQPGRTFSPGTLLKDTTYYWRIDEVEADKTTKHTGDVWSFKTLPDITISDPNLIGWWKLDEGYGSIAYDWSGHGNNGRLGGDAKWVAGIIDGALDLDGSDYVVIDGVADDITGTNITLSAWIKMTQGGEGNVLAANDSASAHPLMFGVAGGNPYVYDGSAIQFPPAVNDGQWHMLTYVRNGSTGYVYVDGVQQGTYTATFDLATVTRWSIGQEWDNATPSNFYNGMVDDVRIYKVPLRQAQIAELMRGDPLLAWRPKPADKSTPDIEKATPLGWTPGDKAAQHDVYFGADQTATTDATTASTGIYRGRQLAASYTPAEALQWGGGPYYWRIDEYNTDGTVSTGKVWSFTIADYLIVDDFEDYTDNVGSRIFQTWRDGFGFSEPAPGYSGNGTGSAVGYSQAPFAELSTVHGGIQAMPLAYDNSGATGKARYSETQREWASPLDWTKYSLKALTLYFYGALANAAEQLYVALEDNAGHVKVVNHPDIEAVQGGAWQEWNIELTQFSGAGVNLKAVKKMYIGLGSRTSPKAGGTGTIYVDDIRAYPSRCVPSRAKPAASFNDDCIVDNLDLQIMAGDWLVRDVPEAAWNGAFSSQDIGAGTAAGSFSFDGNVYTITADGNDIWGTADAFRYAYKQVSGDFQMTVRVTGLDPVDVWSKAGVMIRQSLEPGSANAMIATSGTSGGGASFQWRPTQGASSSSQRLLESAYAVTEPACIRLVRQGSTISGYVFVDGRWQLEGQTTAVVLTGPVYIGLAVTSHVDGTLTTATFDRACVFSASDLRVDGIVDFKDYAVLADSWLEEILWP